MFCMENSLLNVNNIEIVFQYATVETGDINFKFMYCTRIKSKINKKIIADKVFGVYCFEQSSLLNELTIETF